MQDLETESLWSQVNGECISGPWEGSLLKQFPAIHSTYKNFKKAFPHGRLLKKPEKGEAGSPYDSYFGDKEKLGIFGRSDSYARLDGKDKVIGIRMETREVAVAFDYLRYKGLVLIHDSAAAIIVIFNADRATVSAFIFDEPLDTDSVSLNVSENILSIADGKMKWNASTGVAISEGTVSLKIKPIMTAFWFAWASFFPETELIE